jgi:anti-anti-sigma factor
VEILLTGDPVKVNPYRHIETRVSGDTLVIEVTLEQVRDYVLAEELRYELVHAVKGSNRDRFVLDLGTMSFMTSLACVALVGLKHAVREVDGRLVLCNMSPFIRKILETKRLLSRSEQTGRVAFEAVENLDAALACLGAGSSDEI